MKARSKSAGDGTAFSSSVVCGKAKHQRRTMEADFQPKEGTPIHRCVSA